MNRAFAGGSVFALSSGFAGLLLALAVPAPARADDRPDSALVYRWSAVYRSRIDIERRLWHFFPWNDAESASHYNDRLAILGELSWRDRLTFFAKGATGFRLGGDYQEEQFILEQGHLGFNVLGGAVSGRLFSRERVYRTDEMLLPVASDEMAFVGHTEGLAIEAKAGTHASIKYVESAIRDDFTKRGGLPSFQQEEDYIRVLRLESSLQRGTHAGFTIAALHSEPYDDRITVGTDIGIRARGVDLLAQLVRTQRIGWEELRRNPLFELDWDEASRSGFGALFSKDEAFAAEIEGLQLALGGAGSAGLVPGYRFSGRAFTNPVGGEIPRRVDEHYAVAWWRPAKYDALVSVDASTGTRYGRDANRLVGTARMRYRGGFELRESLLCQTGARSAAAVSFIDDNALSRVLLTARIDDAGARNLLSYLAEATVNFGSRIAARSTLFLRRSRTSLYDLELEFRPRERFLFEASAGSFTPLYEGLALEHDLVDLNQYVVAVASPGQDRFVRFYARIWFGGEGVR